MAVPRNNAELREYYRFAYEREGYRMGSIREARMRWLLPFVFADVAEGPRDVCANDPGVAQRYHGFLDVGCGRGETLQFAMETGFQPVLGLEIVPELCRAGPPRIELIDTAASLPIADRSWGTVACFDVLEHVLPYETAAVLDELWRVTAHRLLISVHCGPAPMPDMPELGDPHINQHGLDWWLSRFEEIRGFDDGSDEFDAVDGGFPKEPHSFCFLLTRGNR